MVCGVEVESQEILNYISRGSRGAIPPQNFQGLCMHLLA